MLIKQKKSHLAVVSALALMVAASGCLKTRSQIKGESGGDSQAQGEDGGNVEEPTPPGGYRYEELRNELTRISGKLEELEHHSRSQNLGEVKEYATRLEARIEEMEKNQILIMSELKEIKDRSVPVTSNSRESGGVTPSGRLAEAQTLLASKEYERAAETFRAILSHNPKGKVAVEANFGLGEAEYAQDNFKKAIVAYSKVQELQPKSSRVPAALYKIGMCFERLNMNKEAKGFFAELAERFPKTSEGKKAKARLK